MPELITEENATSDYIKNVLDAAYMDYTMNDKGDFRVKERIVVNVRPNQQQRTIKLFALFGFKPSSTALERLECANKINAEYIVIRCSVASDCLWFEHEFLLDGGLTPKALVQGIKRFANIPLAAISEHGNELIE